MSLPHTVLIVDDSPQMAVNLEIALTTGPEFEVQIVASAKEALAVLNQAGCPVAAIITDLEMPRMNGYELIEILRKHPKWATPIIVSSGTADPDAPTRAEIWARMRIAALLPMKLRKTLAHLLEGTKS
jgi:CheY-like chemotaxis protein